METIVSVGQCPGIVNSARERLSESASGNIAAKLDSLSAADVERFLDGLLAKRSRSTVNRYRTTLHAMLNRAIRHGLLNTNPVKGTTKFKEPEGRTLYLTSEEETAVRDQLAPDATTTGRRALDARRGDLRPLFAVSLHTALRKLRANPTLANGEKFSR